MDQASRALALAVTAIALVGCAEGNCYRKDEPLPPYPGQQEVLQGKSRPTISKAERARRAFVYKYDGSLKCGVGEVISLNEMKRELEGIKVYSEEVRNDGFVRNNDCGQPTGQANVYEIPKKELTKAVGRGFQQWTFTNY